MADNYLEKHREDYELRKAKYLEKKKSHLPKSYHKEKTVVIEQERNTSVIGSENQ